MCAAAGMVLGVEVRSCLFYLSQSQCELCKLSESKRIISKMGL